MTKEKASVILTVKGLQKMDAQDIAEIVFWLNVKRKEFEVIQQYRTQENYADTYRMRLYL